MKLSLGKGKSNVFLVWEQMEREGWQHKRGKRQMTSGGARGEDEEGRGSGHPWKDTGHLYPCDWESKAGYRLAKWGCGREAKEFKVAWSLLHYTWLVPLTCHQQHFSANSNHSVSETELCHQPLLSQTFLLKFSLSEHTSIWLEDSKVYSRHKIVFHYGCEF